jgi:hypothetical protein
MFLLWIKGFNNLNKMLIFKNKNITYKYVSKSRSSLNCYVVRRAQLNIVHIRTYTSDAAIILYYQYNLLNECPIQLIWDDQFNEMVEKYLVPDFLQQKLMIKRLVLIKKIFVIFCIPYFTKFILDITFEILYNYEYDCLLGWLYTL